MVAETDVCDSVAGSPGRPDEVLDKDMQVAARVRCSPVDGKLKNLFTTDTQDWN